MNIGLQYAVYVDVAAQTPTNVTVDIMAAVDATDSDDKGFAAGLKVYLDWYGKDHTRAQVAVESRRIKALKVTHPSMQWVGA